MRTPRQYLSDRYPWLNLTDLLAIGFAFVLAIVILWPHAPLVAAVALISGIAGAVALILWILTFSQQGRVQIGRRKLRYKSVRRIAGEIALICLPLPILRQSSLYFQSHSVLGSRFNQVADEALPYPDMSNRPIGTVLVVAKLQNDKDQQLETRLRDAASNLDPKFHVTPLVLNRTFEIAGRTVPIPSLGAIKSASAARVHLMIWGSANADAGIALGPLYETDFVTKSSFGGTALPDGFKLPELPIEDLTKVVSLMVATSSARATSRKEDKLGDALQPLIAQVRAIAGDPRKTANWSADTRARMNLILGIASEVSGTELKSEDSLHAAVAFIQSTQSDWTHDWNPLEWAMAQENLASALSNLNDLKPQDSVLRAALASYQNALEVYVSRVDSIDAANVEFGLGNLLRKSGNHEASGDDMRRAADFYREAVQDCDIQQHPGSWAAAEYGLGDALNQAAARDASVKEYQDSSAAAKEALKIFHKQSTPMEWAGAQMEIAANLEGLGEMDESRDELKQSIALCQKILDGFPRVTNPGPWAGIQLMLGNAFSHLYQLDKNPESAKQAEAAFRAALDEPSFVNQQVNSALAKDGLGRTLVESGDAQSNTSQIEQGVGLINDALKLVTREHDPLDWAWIKFDLADGLVALSKHDGDAAHLKQAVDAYHEVLTLASKNVMPDLYAKAQDNLKVALNDLHQRGST